MPTAASPIRLRPETMPSIVSLSCASATSSSVNDSRYGSACSASDRPRPDAATFSRSRLSLNCMALAAMSPEITAPKRSASSPMLRMPAVPSARIGIRSTPLRPKICCAMAAFWLAFSTVLSASPMAPSCWSTGRLIRSFADRPSASKAFAASPVPAADSVSVRDRRFMPLSSDCCDTSDSLAAYCRRDSASVVTPSLPARMPAWSAMSIEDFSSTATPPAAAAPAAAAHFAAPAAAPPIDSPHFVKLAVLSFVFLSSASSCSCVSLMAFCAPSLLPVIRIAVVNFFSAIDQLIQCFAIERRERAELHQSHVVEQRALVEHAAHLEHRADG